MTDSKDFNEEYEAFISLENFKLAWRRVRNSDRIEVKNRLALKVFESNTELRLEALIKKVETGYTAQPAERIFAPKKARTLRPYPFLDIHDRLVYQALGNIIIRNSHESISVYADRNVFAQIPQLPDSDFTLLSAKSREGALGQYEKFRDAIIEKRREFQDISGNSQIVKTDIAAFYPSVDHRVLLDVLANKGWLTNSKLVDLLAQCLQTWSRNSEFQFNRGIPIGYETSDILATLFRLFGPKRGSPH